MSTQSGGAPEFDFDFNLGKQYDPERLANEVLWPLVDLKWGGNWREESFVGNELQTYRRGNDIYGTLDAGIEVYCESDYEGGEEEFESGILPRLSTVSIVTMRHLTDERRDMILACARNNSGAEWASGKLEDADDDDLYVISMTKHAIDTDGDISISTTQQVRDIGYVPIWEDVPKEQSYEQKAGQDQDDDSDDESEDICDDTYEILPDRLREHDLEIIESGLIVFGTPQSLLDALKKIKQCPIN